MTQSQSQTQPKEQNKFAALDQKVSDSRENEKQQAQQPSLTKAGDDQSDKTGPQPGSRPDDKQGEIKPLAPAPQQANKPANT